MDIIFTIVYLIIKIILHTHIRIQSSPQKNIICALFIASRISKILYKL